MDCCESLTSSPVAPRAAARRRFVCGLGLFAEIRARRRRPRSAAGRRHPARRAGRPRHRRADRRPRLCRPARLDRADVERTRTRRCRWIRSSRCIRRCRNSRGCTARSRPRWFMRWRRPIASARISTGRTCSKAALPVRAGCNPAGSTARWKSLPKGERVMSASRRRPDHAAGAARRGADRRLGAGGAAAGRRGHRDAPDRTLPPSRSRAGGGADARARSSTRPRRATT